LYDQPLTIEEVLTALAGQPRTIERLTAGTPSARLQRTPPGGWSVNDVLAHLRSCDDMWGRYMRTIAAEDHPTIRAVNPTSWIKSTNYPSLEFAASFRAYWKQRGELVKFLRHLPRTAWSRSATVTGGGRPRERTVLEYGRWLANHERTHLRQIAHLTAEGGAM
jgi:DinB superfamily